MSKNNPFGNLMFIQPPWMNQQQNKSEQRESGEIKVPPRVILAMQYLRSLTEKTQSRIAMGENYSSEFDGQKLTEQEEAAQATAARIVDLYFQGKLPQDETWEKKKRRKRRDPEKRILIPVQCPMCSSPGNRSCPACKGKGIANLEVA